VDFLRIRPLSGHTEKEEEMKWFREWRAWVRSKKADRELQLEKRIKEMVTSMKYPESGYSVPSIIDAVRRHDRKGIE
jgi:hypothetical protein